MGSPGLEDSLEMEAIILHASIFILYGFYHFLSLPLSFTMIPVYIPGVYRLPTLTSNINLKLWSTYETEDGAFLFHCIFTVSSIFISEKFTILLFVVLSRIPNLFNPLKLLTINNLKSRFWTCYFNIQPKKQVLSTLILGERFYYWKYFPHPCFSMFFFFFAKIQFLGIIISQDKHLACMRTDWPTVWVVNPSSLFLWDNTFSLGRNSCLCFTGQKDSKA